MPDTVFDASPRVEEVAAGDAPPLSVLTEQASPLILRGIASHWPLLEHASRSPSDAVNYLAGFYNGRPSMVYRASSTIKGRYFYEQDAASLNYESVRQNVRDFLNELLTQPQDKSLYMASAPVDTYFPGLRPDLQFSQTPHLPPTDGNEPLVSVWIGNQSLASCHFDCNENIACCVAGKRRVVVFPPKQIDNLYPGPVEKTPGGQMISMVDFHDPDYARFPKFKEAIKHAQFAELAPGDGIFIPSMWWHQVEGLSDFNILVNFWWSEAAAFLGHGMPALFHAMLAIRDRPEREKAAFKALFDHYVFGNSDNASAHIPEAGQGVLAELDELQARRLRAIIINQLNK